MNQQPTDADRIGDDEHPAPIRVLLVDDDPLVRAGLRLMLGGASDLEVVGEAGDGIAAIEQVSVHTPDVVLMDVRMPVRDGIEATRRLRAGGRTAPQIIVLTTFDSDATVLDALRAGAAGFLLKHTSPERIAASIREAAAGEPVLSPSVARRLIDHATGPDEPEAASKQQRAQAQLAQLSDREREVALAVARGWSNPQIAEELHLSVGSVKVHISSALAKLELTNRIQLALVAHDAGEV